MRQGTSEKITVHDRQGFLGMALLTVVELSWRLNALRRDLQHARR